jgi:hypothetical protein
MRKELTVQQWIGELERGCDYRKDYGFEDAWSNLEAMFYSAGSFGSAPNLISSNGDALISNVSMSNPYITVESMDIESVPGAKVLERVDNNLMSQLKVSPAMEQAALHAFLWGRGILKIGYDSEFGWDPEQMLGLGAQIGATFSQFDKKGNRIETGPARPGMPWVCACLPHDIVVPWGAIDDPRLPWIAHRVIRHIDDIKSDAKYSNKRDLQPTLSMKDFVGSYTSRIKPLSFLGRSDRSFSKEGTDNAQFCELYEIHDRRTQSIKVLAVGHDKWLRDDEDRLQMDGLPFVTFSFTPTARTFWTTSDAFYLQPYQADLVDIFTQAAKQRRVNILKVLYEAGVIESDYVDKLTSTDVAPFIPVKATGEPIGNKFHVLNVPNNNPMLYNDAEFIMRNARSTIGFSRNQMGEFEARGRRTATEAMTVQQAAEQRLDRRRLVIARAYEDVVRKINQIIFAFWGAPRWVEIAGKEGSEWIMYTGQQLKGNYGYSVILSDEPIRTRKSVMMESLQLYSALSQDPMVNQEELRKMLSDSFTGQQLSRVFGGMKGANLSVQMPGVQPGAGGTPANVPSGNPSQV